MKLDDCVAAYDDVAAAWLAKQITEDELTALLWFIEGEELSESSQRFVLLVLVWSEERGD